MLEIQKTYFASDCGYILHKIDRKFEKIIEIWGADHHGYISRFRAASEALRFSGELKFVIVQLVRLMKNGKEANITDFPSPDELWNKTFADQNEWKEKFANITNEGEYGKRYYQEIAINNVLKSEYTTGIS